MINTPTISRLVSRLFGGVDDPTRGSRVVDARAFEDLARRERDLADRHGLGTAVLVVELTDHAAANRRRALNVCRVRLRATDCVGLLAVGDLAVLLPCTDWESASVVARDLEVLLERSDVEARVQVHADDDERPSGDGRRASAARHRAFEIVGSADRGSSIDDLFVARLPRWKRVVDLVVASAVGLCALPIVALTWAAVRLDSEGPAIFEQRRVGHGGREFTLYKFRSMTVDAEARKEGLRALNEVSGPVFKIAKDPRITRVGRFIRTWSIDELPQLWNVIKGDMTLVGPRPATPDEVEQYEPWQRRRLDVTPGITCTWQVSGRSSIAFDDWMRMDIAYSRRSGIVEDTRILLRTVPAVLTANGAH